MYLIRYNIYAGRFASFTRATDRQASKCTYLFSAVITLQKPTGNSKKPATVNQILAQVIQSKLSTCYFPSRKSDRAAAVEQRLYHRTALVALLTQ